MQVEALIVWSTAKGSAGIAHFYIELIGSYISAVFESAVPINQQKTGQGYRWKRLEYKSTIEDSSEN